MLTLAKGILLSILRFEHQSDNAFILTVITVVTKPYCERFYLLTLVLLKLFRK